ncbi:uncharacterized protein [Centruroides vittatus]|uniref:uncharacterized protein n=1 Tax=Centruroides vittatus TaxID=120091 RepID=UPI00350E8F5F
MDQLEKLRKKRASIRASVTRLISKVDSLVESDDRETETFLEILDQFSRKEESLRTLNGEIEGLITSPTDYDTEIVNSEEYEDKIISCKFKIQSRIKRLEADSSVVMVSQAPVGRNNSANIKLPEIPLPKFSGRYEEWSNFKMQFDNIISSSEQLSAEQKLHYLKAALIGEAKSLETLNDSFASLFQALQERYENKKLIVETHVNAILDSVKLAYESAKGLRNLIDLVNRNMRALKVLGYERNELSDILILNIVLQKLDKETLKQYEFSISSNDVPKLDNLISFLEKRSQILENINKATFVKPRCNQDRVKPRNLFVKCNNSMSRCILCKQNHPVYNCDSFLQLEVSQRNDVVAKNNLCFNCLSDRHKLSHCNSKSCCKICRKRHNTLLHQEKQAIIGSNAPVIDSKPISTKQDLNPDAIEFRESIPHSLSCIDKGNKTVILSTAMVWVLNHTTGASIQARAVLDSGSMSNIVTRDFASRLGTPQERIDLTVSSISGNKTSVKFKLPATIINGNGSFSKTLEFLVVPRITDLLPVSSLHVSKTEIPRQLADPRFATPGKIDMLIGAEAFFEIVKNDQIRLSCNNNLTFRNTVFGYIATGSTDSNDQDKYCGLISESESIDKCLQRFWQIETLTEAPSLMSKEEEYCEDHYQRTHRRNEDGRYIVQMATKEIQNLGESRKLALKRLNQLWKRLSRDKQLKELYQNFMKEYLDLGHMERVQEPPADQTAYNICYYLPHHGVFRPDKTTTRLRVVFNASAPTTSGLSLNDHLLKGEVKEDVFEIMTRFRKYKYAFTADIQKMFRQILIEPSQRDLLRIVWKNEEEEMPVTYRLKTVTYGTASAPFLAVRTLKQLAYDEAARYPLASKTILRDVYMDDIVSGEQDFDAALELQSQLCNMLSTCGMTLHKWNSNSMKLMNSSSPENKEHCFSSSAEPTVKTLGIIWKPVEDQFIFRVSIPEKLLYTKREVLSVIARLYDPLGLLGPVITRAKIFLQKLWLSKLDWEDTLPENLNYDWVNFVSSLKALDDLKITRYILTDPLQRAVLLGYADASESAYGAVVYMHCIKEDGTGKTRLIASKSRVAPLKVMTIPRLELSACLVLSQLVKKVRSCLQMDIAEVILHTDSTIAIAWINTPAYRLKTFIANRVEKIQSITEGCHWKHITSHSNPADVVSRGLNPQDLLSMELWWSGVQSQVAPTVQRQDEYAIDTSFDEKYLSELKKQSHVNLVCVSWSATQRDLGDDKCLTSEKLLQETMTVPLDYFVIHYVFVEAAFFVKVSLFSFTADLPFGGEFGGVTTLLVSSSEKSENSLID